MKKVIAFWLLCGAIGFGMMRFTIFEHFYHREGTDITKLSKDFDSIRSVDYVVGPIYVAMGPVGLIQSAFIAGMDASIPHKRLGVMINTTLMWPKFH